MRMLGAKVVLTPRAEKGFGMYRKAAELAEANGWFLARQFETSANADIHAATTANEILGDFAGQRLDWFVTGYGTGGTMTGVGRVLRAKRPETRIVLAEPANAALLSSGVAQPREPGGAPSAGHPAFEPHPIQGWTPDFIPQVLQEAINDHLFDEVVKVAGPEGIRWAREACPQGGIFVGISAGATFAVARQIAERAPAGRSFWACCPIPASVTFRRRCSKGSKPRWTTRNGRCRARPSAPASPPDGHGKGGPNPG